MKSVWGIEGRDERQVSRYKCPEAEISKNKASETRAIRKEK
jgi:hypothetical protein